MPALNTFLGNFIAPHLTSQIPSRTLSATRSQMLVVAATGVSRVRADVRTTPKPKTCLPLNRVAMKPPGI